jgi:hypothetical protein
MYNIFITFTTKSHSKYPHWQIKLQLKNKQSEQAFVLSVPWNKASDNPFDIFKLFIHLMFIQFEIIFFLLYNQV